MKTLAPRPFWLIVKAGTGRLDVLRTDLATGGEALPVFSFEEEARMFLEHGGLDGDWRVRLTTAGELISVLFGPCAGIGRVLLDPLPGSSYGAFNKLVSVEREAFIEFIEGRPRRCVELDRPGGSAGAGGRRIARAQRAQEDRRPTRSTTGARRATGATVGAATPTRR